MAETSMTLEASPADVWAVLNDPKTFGCFVVGTKRVRRHDPDWPRPGSTLEHTAGVGPLVLHDSSTVAAIFVLRNREMLRRIKTLVAERTR